MGLSYMVMPVVLASTASMVLRFWSSIFWRVTTLTDSGISRRVCTPLPTVTARAAYELLCSLTGSRSMLAFTTTGAMVFSTPTADAEEEAAWRSTQAPFGSCTASRPLPASTWAKPCATLWLPRTPGERRPRVCAGSVDRLTPAATAKSFRAAASGPAAMA